MSGPSCMNGYHHWSAYHFSKKHRIRPSAVLDHDFVWEAQ